MKTLIVEDGFVSRMVMQKMLRAYGPCDIAVNGKEALVAVRIAVAEDDPYDLICLDIIMPEMNGQEVLVEIRSMEKERGIELSKGARILMTTGAGDMANVYAAFNNFCDGYLVKPIEQRKLEAELRKLKLIP